MWRDRIQFRTGGNEKITDKYLTELILDSSATKSPPCGTRHRPNASKRAHQPQDAWYHQGTKHRAEYRPFLNDNFIIVSGIAGLIPGNGFHDLFRPLRGDAPDLFAAFVEFIVEY